MGLTQEQGTQSTGSCQDQAEAPAGRLVGLVGEVGFEPTTTRFRGGYADQLRYSPTVRCVGMVVAS